MALGKKRKHFRKRHSHRDYTPEEAANLLAPPEEQEATATTTTTTATPPPNSNNGGQSIHNVGSIFVGTGELNLPKGFDPEQEQDANLFRLDPVVIFILVAVLAFIGFIAYLISIEPPK